MTYWFNVSLFLGVSRGLFTLLRLFSSTRYIVSMIVNILSIMSKFLALILVMLFAFSINLFALDLKNKKTEGYKLLYDGSVYEAFLDAYKLMLMADGIVMQFNTLEEYILYYIGTLFFLVIMMNLLISVITEVYTIILKKKVSADTREKIESLLDVY